ncbi:hypothetical protein JXA63_05775 [Candidatus Woesebacteria bacterium]|nr:hypothetical protein [Candidatus Woesebacteria bacterium]
MGINDVKRSDNSTPKTSLTLERAVRFGEYNPEYLASFPEWHELSRNIQFQYIKDALDNRIKVLRVRWAEVVNVLDFSKKAYLQEALKNIEKQIKKVEEDRERLYLKYSTD